MFPFPDAAFNAFDFGASFLWALSGAMPAARRGYDIMGIAVVIRLMAVRFNVRSAPLRAFEEDWRKETDQP